MLKLGRRSGEAPEAEGDPGSIRSWPSSDIAWLVRRPAMLLPPPPAPIVPSPRPPVPLDSRGRTSARGDVLITTSADRSSLPLDLRGAGKPTPLELAALGRRRGMPDGDTPPPLPVPPPCTSSPSASIKGEDTLRLGRRAAM